MNQRCVDARGFAGVLAILLLGPLGQGCDAAGVPESYTVRDSAGIRIIESTAPAWRAGDVWTVEDTPVLQIGTVDGAPDYQFSVISSLWRLEDGRIMASDRLAAQIRAFDSQGNFLSSFGRQGDGPGEFRFLDRAAPFRGDSIVAWGSNRMAMFDGGGRLGRTLTLTLPPPEFMGTGAMTLSVSGGPEDVFPDGTLLVRGSSGFRANPGDLISFENPYHRYSSEGEPIGELYTVSGGTTRMPTPGGSPPPPVPYPRQFVRAIDRTGLYTGGSAGFELEHRREDGTVDRVIRAFHRELAMDEGAREAYRENARRSAQGQADPAAMEAALREVEFPATIPPYAQALVDPGEHLWVRHYPLTGNTLPQTWSIFAPEGHLLGTVETPARFQVRQIGSDFVLGIWTDELDVQYIRMYPLSR